MPLYMTPRQAYIVHPRYIKNSKNYVLGRYIKPNAQANVL